MVKHLITGSGISFVISLLSLILVARLFTLDFISELKAIVLYSGLISTVFTFQLHSAFLYFSNKINYKQEKFIFLLIFLCVIFASVFFYFFYPMLNPLTKLTTTSLVLFSAYTGFNILFIMSPAIFTIKKQNEMLPKFMFNYSISSLLALLITYIISSNISIYICIYILFLIITFLSSNWLHYFVETLKNISHIDFSGINKILIYARGMFLSNFIEAIADKIDKIFANRFMSSAMFAKYSVVCFENPLVNILLNSYGIKAVKNYSSCHNSKEFQKFWENTVREITFITYPISAILFYYSEQIVTLLFGSVFISATVVFKIYALVSIVRPLPYQALLRMENLINFNIVISIFFIFIAIIVSISVILFSNSLLMLSLSYLFGWSTFNLFAIYFLCKKLTMYRILEVSKIWVIILRILQSFPICYIMHYNFKEYFITSIILYCIVYLFIIIVSDSYIRKKILDIFKWSSL